MDRIARIRAEEKKYHDSCYEKYDVFEPGTWLHKPVKSILDVFDEFKDRDYVSVLDLGSGVGRNSIPMAKSMRNRSGQVVCVDILPSAMQKLEQYSKQYGIEQYIIPRVSDIEQFRIEPNEYDMIIAVSALEHVSSESALIQKLHEMSDGTKREGVNCIIIGSNIQEENSESGIQLDPMFEVNLTTERMLSILDTQYMEWEVVKRQVKKLEYDIDRNGQPVRLITDVISYVVKKIDKRGAHLMKAECE